MRLFFALWPDEAAAAALSELALALAGPLEGKPTPRARIHLTLAFLGEIDEAGLGRAIDAGDAVRAGEAEVALDQVGCFRRARVAWAGSDRAPPALAALHERLRTALSRRGLPVEERGFTPHVTVVRGTRRSLPRAALPRPIAWTAESFSLVHSRAGTGEYETLASWDLAQG